MLTIGFTNHYYTLWNVITLEYSNSQGHTYLRTNYNYMQNLSMNLKEAEAKIKLVKGGHILFLK